jgi:uncharacterized membrane protein YqjE
MTQPNVYESPGAEPYVRRDDDDGRGARSGARRDRGSEGDRRSIAALFGDLLSESTTLIRQEIDLAKAEASQKVGQVGRGAAMLGAGGAVAFAGFLYLLLSASVALENWVEPWLAPLIVGAVTLIVGLILLGVGRSRMSADSLQPRRTLRTLEEDREWARAQVRR